LYDTLIIIPAYNEELCIGDTIRGLLESGCASDILVVNDGSSDHTGSIVEKLPVFLVQHPINLGYGAALQTGYKFAKAHGYQYVAQFDADGQHHTDDLKNLLDELCRNDADIVIGSRFLGNPSLRLGRKKTIAINAFRFMIKLLTRKRVTDPTSGLRGMNARLFGLFSRRGQFPADFPDADIIIHILLNRYRLREFPIGSREREMGESMHSGLKPVIYMFKVVLSIMTVWINYQMNGRRRDLDA